MIWKWLVDSGSRKVGYTQPLRRKLSLRSPKSKNGIEAEVGGSQSQSSQYQRRSELQAYMKVLYWNVRGIANPESRRVLFNLVSVNKPDLLVLAEPMCTFERTPRHFWRDLNFSLIASNSREGRLPNIWVLSKSARIVVFHYSEQCVALSCFVQGVLLNIAFVYASTCYNSRKALWSTLSDLAVQHVGPWLYLGDFNVVLGAHEKMGGLPPRATACSDFVNWISHLGLIDVLTKGSPFTWSNGSAGAGLVKQRLDRLLCNRDSLVAWDAISCSTLPKLCSDHHPLLASVSKSHQLCKSHFKFHLMWSLHQDCREVVSRAWHSAETPCAMRNLLLKLQNVKLALKAWNTETFGNVHSRVRVASDDLLNIQKDPCHSQEDEAKAQHRLMVALSYEEAFWKEKARLKWFQEGDQNTSFFFQIVKARWLSNNLAKLTHGSRVADTPQSIEELTVDFFQNFFSADSNCSPNELIDTVVPKVVSPSNNYFLTQDPSCDEVKQAVFAMHGLGAPGPDGFGGLFYQKYWDLVHQDVYKAVLQFYQCGSLLPGINSSLLVLIPKEPYAEDIIAFRPIALTNFLHKIITKILADRLAVVAAKFVSPQQQGFLKGREVLGNIAMASEAFNILGHRVCGRNVILKLNFFKAFDTLDWSFLLHTLDAFGFSSKFIN
ncbi:hypothetical protein Fmac_010489 [Flemingia macrophylla]|uniref:Reverse transcriptase domain-containing protein n=1 Tax=Flemingia macrophylla TaxID=520843 RepID=A0ABD1MJQ5_9FABA